MPNVNASAGASRLSLVWRVDRYTDFTQTYTLKNRSTGQPISLAGAWVLFTVKLSAELTDDQAIYAHDWQIDPHDDSGQTTFSLPSALTSAWPAPRYHFDAMLITPITQRKGRYLAGDLYLDPVMTRRTAPLA
jgi:hypothetical protein